MKKRLFSILLALLVTVSLLPTGALAYVGAKWDTGGAQDFYTDGNRFVMENDYIYFSVFDTSPDFLELKAKNDTSAGHSGITLEFFVEYPGQAKREMNVESATLRTDGAQNSGMVTAVFTFGNDHYQTPGDVEMTYTVNYQLVRLDEGSTGSGTVTEPIMLVEGDAGTTWALFADGEFEFEGEALPVFAGDDHATVSVRASLLWFSNFGHPEYDGEVPQAPVMISKADLDYGGPVTADYSTTNISQGLDWMATNPDENDTEYHINEVFVDSYAYANPFVATSQFYNYFDTAGTDNDQGVWGFEGVRFPTQICYERDDDFGANYAYSCLMVETETSFHEPNSPQTADLLIGYRDLINTQEDELPTDPDEITISSNADRLAVYADGTVTPYYGSGSVSGNPVAVIRGDFELSNGVYNFTGGAAALSPTVTATWGDGGYLRISNDGTVAQSGVHLNAPSFKFYQPQSGHEDALSLSFGADGLEMSGMGNNDAVLNIDIPGTSTTVTEGTATVNGGLTFEGSLRFNNMFSQAELNMTELSYALNQGVFTVNGVKANGSFGSVNLLGFTLGEVDGSIDTFTDTYDFTASINVFSLLEAEGELQLKRTDNGELMPNNLYFEVDSAIGIPLVPPAPVVKLTGGGAGFYGLADTANGDWYAIPPLKFRGSVDAEIVEFLEADGANIVLGPSEFELSVDELKIAGTNFAAFSGGIGMYLGGDKMTYNNTEYSGLSASGRFWLDIDLPSQSLNFLVFDGELAAGIFGGMNGNDLYLRGYGNSRSYAELQFPDSWPLVGGWNLLGVGVDAAVAAETLIDGDSVSDAVSSAFENMDLQVGLAATGSFLGSDVRVWVILPDVAQNSREDYNWGWDFKFWGSLGRWDWSGTAMNIPSNASAAPALMSAALMSNDSNSTASRTITVSGTGEEDTAYLVLSFPEGTQIDLGQVSVTKDNDANFSFTPEQISVDGNGTITNSDTANIISDIVPLADGSGSSERVLIIKVGEGIGADGTYTVSFGGDEGTIEPAYSTANVVSPADGLGGMSSSDGGRISVEVEYPEEDAKYILRTYLGTDENGTDYLVDEREVDQLDEDGWFSFTIPTNGTAAPTGDYYITSCLLKEVSYTDNNGEPQKGYIAIDSIGNGTPYLHYTNNAAPADAPATVSLDAVGNEVMTASWSAVDGVDGYKIVIYEQDAQGNWVDSGYGYEYDASQFGTMPGLSYDEDTQTYSIDMAMTVGGQGVRVDENGNLVGGNGETQIALDANKSYKVGVAAYNSESVEIAGETQNVKYYGPEGESNEELLPEYEPLDMTIQYLAATGGGQWRTITADSNGIYNLSVYPAYTGGGGYGSIGISVPSGTDATFTLTYYKNGQEMTETFSTGSPGFWRHIPDDFEGSLMLEITGSVTSNGITDTTTRYVLVTVDDTAPIITLDEDVFYADNSGSYTVTGVTEPGATVGMSGYYGEPVTAGTDGTFSLTGTLASGSGSALLVVTATDAAGNEGGDDALVTKRTDDAGESAIESVAVSPTTASVARGGTQQFTATVTGTGTYDNTVNWSVAGNASSNTTITAGGLLTVGADETATALTVTATANGNNTRSATATVTVTEPGYDPGPVTPGVTTYPPVISDTDNGTVTVSPPRPSRGQTVTINAEPDEGYEVDEVTVTDQNGNEVDVTDKVGKWSFTQPGNRVTITVTFRAVSSVSDCPRDETCPMVKFTDVDMDSWYHDGIHFCIENGLMNGVSDTLFEPDGTTTRAQLVTILYRLENEPVAADSGVFTDVADGTWYTDAVAWAAEHEIVDGYGGGLFGPNDPVTREQLAAILHRYAVYKGYDVSIGEDTNILSYTDFDHLSEWAIPAMQWSCGAGIINGTSDTTLDPKGSATRAQVAAMLMRFCENIAE